MKIFKTIDSFINKIEGAILIFLLLIMLIMAFGQVVLRNFFSGGVVWGDILLRHLVMWIGFLGAALATSNERHLNIDVLTRYLPARLKGIIAALANIFAATICFLLSRASITFIEFEINNKNIVFGDIPSWYAQIVIPIGYGLLTFHFLIRALIDIHKSIKKEAG